MEESSHGRNKKRVFAGNETTAKLMGQTLVRTGQAPDQRERSSAQFDHRPRLRSGPPVGKER